MERLYTPAILDIEASGFGKGSYPIEIGVAAETGEVYSWLVLPEQDWTHWREEAASLHLITREQLQSEGVRPNFIADELNALFEGQTLYSDGWGFDSGWLSLLFYVARKSMLFRLDTLPKILSDDQLAHWDKTKARLSQKNNWEHHRAGIDAHLLQLTYKETAIDEQLRKAQ